MNEIIVFIVAIFLRILSSYGVNQGFDSYGHIYFSKELKKQRKGPFGSIKTKVIGSEYFSAPFLWHWLIEFIPIKILSKYPNFMNPILDSIAVVIFYTFIINIGYEEDLAFIAALLYILTPMWFTKFAMGPRIADFTPRVSGEIATNLFFIFIIFPVNDFEGYSFAIATIFAVYVMGSSKFGVQALIFMTPLVSVLLETFNPLLSVIFGLLILIILSGGKYAYSLIEQFEHLRWYFLKNMKGGTKVSNRNKIDKRYARESKESLKRYILRLLGLFISVNAYTGLLIKMPVLWVTCILMLMSDNIMISSNIWVPVLVGILMFFIINIRWLLFLGEAERYINHVAFFILLMGIEVAHQENLHDIYWLIIIYGTLFLIAEVFLNKMTSRKNIIEMENKNILSFLAGIRPTTVLTFPYHAGGGVYRIMSETPHKTIFPYTISDKNRKKLENGYLLDYPYFNLSKLENANDEFNVNVFVLRTADVMEKFGANWKPSSSWIEYELGLKLQKVFVNKNYIYLLDKNAMSE